MLYCDDVSGQSPMATKLKLYAQVCVHLLAPLLKTHEGDIKAIFEQPPAAPRNPPPRPPPEPQVNMTPGMDSHSHGSTPSSQDEKGGYWPHGPHYNNSL